MLLTACTSPSQVHSESTGSSISQPLSPSSESESEQVQREKSEEIREILEIDKIIEQELAGKTLQIDQNYYFYNGETPVVIGGAEPITSHAEIADYYPELSVPEQIGAWRFNSISIESADNPRWQELSKLPEGVNDGDIITKSLQYDKIHCMNIIFLDDNENQITVTIQKDNFSLQLSVEDFQIKQEDESGYTIYYSETFKQGMLVWSDSQWNYAVIVQAETEADAIAVLAQLKDDDVSSYFALR